MDGPTNTHLLKLGPFEITNAPNERHVAKKVAFYNIDENMDSFSYWRDNSRGESDWGAWGYAMGHWVTDTSDSRNKELDCKWRNRYFPYKLESCIICVTFDEMGSTLRADHNTDPDKAFAMTFVTQVNIARAANIMDEYS